MKSIAKWVLLILSAFGIVAIGLLHSSPSQAAANGTPNFSGASSGGASCTAGDIKTGFQAANHAGWVLMQGQAKTSLTAGQQAAATALSIGANLPDARDRVLVGASAGKVLRSTGGASAITLAQNQLPNVGLAVSGSFSGASPVYGFSNTANGGAVPSFATAPSAQVSQSIPVSGSISGSTGSINGGVTQQAIDTTPAYLSVNSFLCLGA